MNLANAKYYLQAENDRNTHNGSLFIELIKAAFGVEEVVLVGHHFVFEPKASMEALDLKVLNEIPSVDTMIFDHDIMGVIFGGCARYVMQHLAAFPVTGGERDKELAECFARKDNKLQLMQMINTRMDCYIARDNAAAPKVTNA